MILIDLVIPMVFPQDPQWQARYAAASGKSSFANNHVRFRSWGTEELLVRCCLKYMPWLRTIHILLASESQVQDWMKPMSNRRNTPKINLVYHRDFIPALHLPCFNVNTIEMFLHKIPFLAEHFIYSNDDFFPLSPLAESDFFRDGLPCQHMTEKPYPTDPNVFHRFVKGGLDMVAADFGKQYTDTWIRGSHSMQPMLRSTVEEVCTRHADRISKSFSFRRSDRNFNQYIFPYYQHLSGKYVDYEPRHAYVGPKATTAQVEAYLRKPNLGIVCLNDNESIADWEQRAAVVRRELAAILER